jgi:hypothetical protein
VFSQNKSGVEVIAIKSSDKRYYIRSNSEFRGFIIHTHNYQKDTKKIEIEEVQNANEENETIEYNKINQVIIFDSEKNDEVRNVYLVLSNPPNAENDREEKKLFFSSVRMNEEFGKESEVVWWIYLVIALITLLFLLICGMMIAVCMTKVEKSSSTDDSPLSTNSGSISKSSGLTKSDVEHFKTEESNPLPPPLNNEYINKDSSVSKN